MYTMDFDYEPSDLGFKPHEVKNNADGTFTVVRKFYRLSVWDPYCDARGGDGWCPCRYEIFDGANWAYGGHYYIEDGPEICYGKNRVIDHLCIYTPQRKYGLDFTEEETNNIKKLSSYFTIINSNHPRYYREDVANGCTFRWGSAPTDPYHDPFLPENFKKMLGNAYVGYDN